MYSAEVKVHSNIFILVIPCSLAFHFGRPLHLPLKLASLNMRLCNSDNVGVDGWCTMIFQNLEFIGFRMKKRKRMIERRSEGKRVERRRKKLRIEGGRIMRRI